MIVCRCRHANIGRAVTTRRAVHAENGLRVAKALEEAAEAKSVAAVKATKDAVEAKSVAAVKATEDAAEAMSVAAVKATEDGEAKSVASKATADSADAKRVAAAEATHRAKRAWFPFCSVIYEFLAFLLILGRPDHSPR